MLDILKSGTSLGRGEVDLFFRTFAWMFKAMGGLGASRVSGPIFPTTGYFALQGAKNHEWAEEIFKWVKIYSGMPDWRATLQQGARKKVIPAGQLFWSPKSNAGFGRQGLGGTSQFQQMRQAVGGQSINIIYHPELLNDPTALIAKLACDTAFHVKMGLKGTPPEGWNSPEELTELTAIHNGFGVFLANSLLDPATERGKLPHGWRSRRQSYLSQDEVLFALAIFCYMTGTPTPLVLSHLRHPLRDSYSRAARTVNAKSYKLYNAIDQF